MIRIAKNFLPQTLANNLRREFEVVYEDPRHSHPKRFLWDHWYLADQYKMHRTPAQDFFSKSKYEQFVSAVTRFGQDVLGCHTISQPWLSYYTSGDRQNFHTDSPHGPWAFVYSLTPWSKRKFRGGETLILNSRVLNYWTNFNRTRGMENQELFKKIPANFNQLLVFDPRVPHGVQEISGVEDPLEGRLVIHGWFVPPEPFVTGKVDSKHFNILIRQMNEQLAPFFAASEIHKNLCGTLIVRLWISSSGKTIRTQVLTDTLVTSSDDSRINEKNQRSIIIQQLRELKFGKINRPVQLTIPLLFD